MNYAFFILLAASGIGAAILVALWKSTEIREKGARNELEGANRELFATRTAVQISEAARADEKARLESVIAGLKKEIQNLETDLAACSSPDAVRERLRRLLTIPSDLSSSSGGGTPYGGVPK